MVQIKTCVENGQQHIMSVKRHHGLEIGEFGGNWKVAKHAHK